MPGVVSNLMFTEAHLADAPLIEIFYKFPIGGEQVR